MSPGSQSETLKDPSASGSASGPDPACGSASGPDPACGSASGPDPACGSASGPAGGEGDGFLFPQLDLLGPLQELESTAERKLRIYENLGEEENVRRLERALQIARTRLSAVLSSPRTPAGS